MRRIVLLSYILTISCCIFGQHLTGLYTEDSDYIRFKEDSIAFKVGSNGGLITDLHGTGKFNIIDGFMLIKTLDYVGVISSCKMIKRNDKVLNFTILDPKNNPLSGVQITLTDKKNRLLSGTVSNEDGQAIILDNKNAKRITFSLIGFDTYTINYSEGYNYEVYLMDYQVIQNTTVVFKINSMNPDSLNLTLLTTDLKRKTQVKAELKRLENVSNKSVYRERLFIKKELVPTLLKPQPPLPSFRRLLTAAAFYVENQII